MLDNDQASLTMSELYYRLTTSRLSGCKKLRLERLK